jgi:hypothetical protein
LKINIFYSWQSDLPNNTNRGFIQSCIETAVKNLSKQFDFQVDFNLDRDTKDEYGTPNIVETIFKKIDRTYIFIGDVSIINSNDSAKKTPNPNVLLELGYAAKVLGWEKIICLYNLDYGKPEDLPFDIKFRRPLIYLIDPNQKSKSKERLVKSLEKSIEGILKKYPIQKRINDHLKVEIDTEILSTINHLFKILFSRDEQPFSLKAVSEILAFDEQKLYEILASKKILGFKIFKNWSETEKNINSLLEKPLTKYSLDEEILNNIVSIIWKIKDIESLLGSYGWFKETDEESKNHKVVGGVELNPENQKLPNRFILLRHLKEDKFLVEDFGDFTPELDKKILTKYFIIEKKAIQFLAIGITNFFAEIHKWLDLTDNEFIVDEKMFRPKVKGE